MKSAGIVLALTIPFLVVGQHYKAKYQCDFETSDCGFHAESDTGAYFSRGEVNLGNRKTHGLVLGELPNNNNWLLSRNRVAQVVSPAIFPGSLFGKVTVSLDVFLVDRTCVNVVQFGQATDNGTRVLGQVYATNEWTAIKASIEDSDQPLRVVVEAHLHSMCHEKRNCNCTGSVVVDNLRISSSEMSTTVLEFPFGGETHNGNGPTDPELTLGALNAAFQELRVINRRSVEDELENLEEEDALAIITPRPGVKSPQILPPFPDPDPGIKSIPVIPPPICSPPPVCPSRIEWSRNCIFPSVKECHYRPRPEFCQCVYNTECPIYICPEILPCPPDPPCPTYPPWNPKSWDPKRYGHAGGLPLLENS